MNIVIILTIVSTILKKKEEDNNDDESTYWTESDGDSDLFEAPPDTFQFIDKEGFGSVLAIGDDFFMTVTDIQPTNQRLRPK